MMSLTEKYRAAIQVLRQELEVIAHYRNPNDEEQLMELDRQIAGAEAGLSAASCSGDHLCRCPRCDHAPD